MIDLFLRTVFGALLLLTAYYLGVLVGRSENRTDEDETGHQTYVPNPDDPEGE